MKVVILHDIRSHYNVGAIFRTADGAGVSHIYVTGFTPTPIDRFGRPVPEIHKTALGAETVVPWSYEASLPVLIATLQAAGVWVVAVEQRAGSTLLGDFTATEKTAFILGSETEGVPEAILTLVDEVLELPMRGSKESLNVSVTAGIVLYHSH